MDGGKIDQLARLVGSGQSRRRVLRTLAGGALAAAATTLGLGQADAAKLRSAGNSCNSNGDCASGLCVQEARTRKICHCVSPSDCPQAKNICSTTTCLGGACGFTNNDFVSCDDGNSSTCNDQCLNGICAGTPVNLNTDNNNCGSCGNACTGANVTCGGNGTPGVCGCLAATSTCSSDGQCCSGGCFEGACLSQLQGIDSACDSDGDCQSGHCCGGACLDVSSDILNCGGCNNVCSGNGGGAQYSCTNGSCGFSCVANAPLCVGGTFCCSAGDACTEDDFCCPAAQNCPGYEALCCPGGQVCNEGFECVPV